MLETPTNVNRQSNIAIALCYPWAMNSDRKGLRMEAITLCRCATGVPTFHLFGRWSPACAHTVTSMVVYHFRKYYYSIKDIVDYLYYLGSIQIALGLVRMTTNSWQIPKA